MREPETLRWISINCARATLSTIIYLIYMLTYLTSINNFSFLFITFLLYKPITATQQTDRLLIKIPNEADWFLRFWLNGLTQLIKRIQCLISAACTLYHPICNEILFSALICPAYSKSNAKLADCLFQSQCSFFNGFHNLAIILDTHCT